MSEGANDYSSAVNKMIAVSKDAEEGFRGAANAVKDPTLQSLFNQLSSERAGFAKELRAAVMDVGLKPEDSSGVLGALHHGWIALKGVLSGDSEHQILEETERGEDFSISRYAMPSRINCRHRCVLCWRLNTSKCSKLTTGLRSSATLLRRVEMRSRNESSVSFIYLSQEGQFLEIPQLLSAIATGLGKAGVDGCPDLHLA